MLTRRRALEASTLFIRTRDRRCGRCELAEQEEAAVPAPGPGYRVARSGSSRCRAAAAVGFQLPVPKSETTKIRYPQSAQIFHADDGGAQMTLIRADGHWRAPQGPCHRPQTQSLGPRPSRRRSARATNPEKLWVKLQFRVSAAWRSVRLTPRAIRETTPC